MDWRAVKFDWNKARGFLVTAEEGSRFAAARALGMAQPTLGRQVGGLEQELGMVLFERVGRGLNLTLSPRRSGWPTLFFTPRQAMLKSLGIPKRPMICGTRISPALTLLAV